MPCFALVLLILAAASSAFAASTPVPNPSVAVICTTGSGACGVSKKEWKQAGEAFRRGLKFDQQKKLEEAFDAYRQAAGLVPRNLDYITAREMARQRLVYVHLQKGNDFLLASQRVQAMAQFRIALELDPSNDFALQRVRDALGDDAPQISPSLQLIAQADQVQLQPLPGRADIHYSGEIRGLYQLIAQSFGVTVAFDESVGPRAVRFDVQDVNFSTAARLAGDVSRTFWAPVSESQFIVAADSPQNHRQYDRISLRSFYASDVSSPQELNDLVTALRGVFDVRMVSLQPQKSIITLRAPTETLQAATRFLELLQGGPPQVMLDVRVFEIDHTVMRALGIQLPLQFNMFNIPAAALLLLSQPNIQQLIDQLVASGGLNQANSAAVQALLAQLQNQRANPIFNQPFATFGGGITKFGVSIPPASANFHFNQSSLVNLEHVTMRAMQGRPSTFRVGQRYPVLNATFAPLLNSSQLSRVIQNGSFQPAFPSFSYEDLGLSVKATPVVHAGNDVTLDLETEIKALSGQTFNGVPVISNRAYKGNITVKDGETAVVAGMVTNSEIKSLVGLPGFSRIPGLGLLTSSGNKQAVQGEILVVITPHLLSRAPSGADEVYLGAGK